MQLSICSFSFHRLLAQGKQDIFRYISDCKDLGCTQLDPWNAHLAQLEERDAHTLTGQSPEAAELVAQDEKYLQSVKAAGEEAGLPFGCIAVDGAHIYDDKPEWRQKFRDKAYRWIEVSRFLGAKQIRIDAGGQHEMTGEMFDIIVEGYHDLVARGREASLEIVMENHWGASQVPENVVRILDAVPGLGLLFDTNNWAPGMQERGWELCARYARITHVKTFSFDEKGNDPSVDLHRAIELLKESGYSGCWGIESCPTDGDEYAGARQTIELVRREVNA